MKLRESMFRRTFLWCMVAAATPLLILLVLSSSSNRQAARNEARAWITSLTTAQHPQLDTLAKARAADLATLSSAPVVVRGAEQLGALLAQREPLTSARFRAAAQAPFEEMRRDAAIHGDADVLLVTAAGDVAVATRSRYELGTNLRTGPWRDTPLAAAVEGSRVSLKGESSGLRMHRATGQPALFLAVPIRQGATLAGFLVAQPSLEAMAPLSAGGLAWLASLSVALVALAVALVAAIRIVRPVLALHQGALAAAQRDGNQRLDALDRSELGQVSVSFNQLLDKLRDAEVSHGALAKEVESLKTASREAHELRSTTSELQGQNRDLQAQVQAVTSDLEKRKADLQALVAELEKTRGTMLAIQADAQVTKDAYEKAAVELQAVQVALEKARTASQEIGNQLEKAKAENAKKNAELEKFTGQAAKQAKALQKVTEELAARSRDLERTESHQKSNRQALAEAQEQIKVLEGKLRGQQGEIARQSVEPPQQKEAPGEVRAVEPPRPSVSSQESVEQRERAVPLVAGKPRTRKRGEQEKRGPHWLQADLIEGLSSKEPEPRSSPAPKATQAPRTAAAITTDGLPDQIGGIDVASGLRRVANNRSLYRSLLIRFRDSQGRMVERVRHSIAEGDTDQARRLVQSVRGVAGNVCATEVLDAARAVEEAFRDEDQSSVEESLSRLEAALSAVVNALRGLDGRGGPEGEPASDSAKGLDRDFLRIQLIKLEALIRAENSDASEEVKSILPTVGGSDLEEAFKGLARRVASRDAVGSLAEIERLRALLRS